MRWCLTKLKCLHIQMMLGQANKKNLRQLGNKSSASQRIKVEVADVYMH
jgi:hypothetical protein